MNGAPMTSLPASVSPAGPEAADGPETPADPETSGGAEGGRAEGGGAEAPGRAAGGQPSSPPGGAETRDGARTAGLPAVWLRFNCRCPLCRDPVSGQRLLRITDIPADISVAGVTASSGTVEVLFHPDGHRAVFDNTRVLHARTGFAGGGRRHLQGCYADLDGIESAVAVGERATTDDTRRKDRI
jgi:hypothetical protein